MNERQIKYILEIAKEGNLTSAAQKLYISQPSLSGLLAKVEKELDAKLFDRSVTPMKLTYAGQQYVKAAEQIIIIVNDMNRKIDQSSTLNIGCNLPFSPLIFPFLLPALTKQFPDIKLNLLEADRSLLEHNLQSRSLDLAIFACVDNKRYSGIECIPVYKAEFLLFTPFSRKFNKYPNPEDPEEYFVKLKEFENEAFILMKSGHQVRDVIDHLFQLNNFQPRQIIETDNWKNCIRLTEKGLGCTILPDYSLGEPYGLVTKSRLNQKFYRELSLCYFKDDYLTQTMKDVVDFIVSFMQNVG